MRYLKRRSRLRLRASSAYAVEALESRVLLSTFMVTNLNDSGAGSLRDDIQMSNATPGANTITFAAGLSGTITLTSGELEISNISGQTTIIGPGIDVLSVSADSRSRIFQIDLAATAEIDGLAIKEGHAADGTNGNNGTSSSGATVLPTAGTAGSDGGGIYNMGTLTLSGDLISHNYAGSGGWGGASARTGQGYGTGADGGKGGDGGGVYSSGALAILNSTIEANSAGSGGAGGYGTPSGSEGTPGNGSGIFASGPVTLMDSTLSDNQSLWGGSGGAIFSSAALTIANCTIAGNLAGGTGGGISAAGATRVTSSTITANIAGDAGGIDTFGDTLLNDTIVAGNTTRGGLPSDVRGELDSAGGFNLIGYGTGMDGLTDTNGNQIGTSASPIDPKLAPLSNYLGPTNTMPPFPGSPAIDAGSNAVAISTDGTALGTDQRGLPRIFGASVDIGAVEAQPLAIPLTVQTTLDLLQPTLMLSLRTAVNLAAITPGSHTITFDPAVFASGVPQTIALTQGPLLLSAGNMSIVGPGTAILTLSGNQNVTALEVAAGATARVSGLTFRNGAGYSPSMAAIANDGHLAVNTCTFSCFYDAIANSNTLAVNDSIFRGWMLSRGIRNSGTFSVTRGTFSGDVDVATIQGIVNEAGSGTVMASRFLGNGAFDGTGGAIENKAGSITVVDSTFTADTSGAGGAIYSEGTLVVNGCTFTENAAGYAGGAIFATDSGSVAIDRSTFAKNAATGTGGAIDVDSGLLVVTNSTFFGNSSVEPANMVGGGAIYIGGLNTPGTAIIDNCTVVGNRATGEGGGIFAASGTVRLANSIVAENTGPGPGSSFGADLWRYFLGGALSGSNNLIGTGDSGILMNGVNGNIVGVADPMVEQLGDYGGPTQTMPPLPGSPAIDAGSNALAVGPDGKPLLTDQRGYYRIFNGTVDIGAVEYGSVPLLPGDANADGAVGFADLVLVARNFGKTNATWSDGDFNNDGSVGFDDLLIVARNYRKSASLAATAAVFSASVVGAAPPSSEPVTPFNVGGLPHHRRRP